MNASLVSRRVRSAAHLVGWMSIIDCLASEIFSSPYPARVLHWMIHPRPLLFLALLKDDLERANADGEPIL